MELTPGELDDAARFAFRNGQCHSMGAALAERTGWPVIVLVDRTTYKHTGRTDDGIRHIFVEAPDGTWIDVNGFNDPVIELEDAYEAIYNDDEHYLTEPLLITTDAEGVRGLATKAGNAKLGLDSEVCMLPTCIPLARTYVDEILTEAGWTEEAIRRGQPENNPV